MLKQRLRNPAGDEAVHSGDEDLSRRYSGHLWRAFDDGRKVAETNEAETYRDALCYVAMESEVYVK